MSTKHLFVPKGAFTPPFETPQSLKDKLATMYEAEAFQSVRAISTFVCHKR